MLTLNYAPEPTGFAPHATALAEHLAHRGHRVTVVTGFPFAPGWKRWPEYRGAVSSEVLHSGVTLRRVSHFVPRRPGSAWQRVAMEASFCVAASAALWWTFLRQRAGPDAVIYIGAQPAIAMLARLVGWLSGAPYFVNITDLAARAACDVGIVRPGWLQRMLERFEFAAYLPSAGASVLCRSFAQALIARGYPADGIRLLRSPVDLAQITPLPFQPAYRQRLGIPANAFVVLVAGSMGLKQGLTNVVKAALRLSARGRGAEAVLWLLVGDGETRAEIDRQITRHRLGDTVRLLPFQPAADLAQMFAAADVLLLNQLATVRDAVVPSKLLTYLASGRPVLAAVHPLSQGADILRAAGGGLLVEPDDPAALVQGVEALMRAGASTLAGMGRRNRLYAERHFDQRTILAEHESFIVQRLAQRRAGHPVRRELVPE